jgi:hypothetical protein
MESLKNFTKIGHWELNAKYTSSKVMSHLPSIGFKINDIHKNTSEVIYAFSVKDKIIYVGQTTRKIKDRLADYRRGFDKKQDTDNRVKERITELLVSKKTIDIFIYRPIVNFIFNNKSIEIPISKSLEKLIIELEKPEINKEYNKG